MSGREKLKAAFIKADRDYFSDVIASTGLTFEPSARFESGISRIIRRRQNPAWKYVNSAAKRAAVIIVLLMVSLGTLMSVKAIREPVINYVMTVFEKYTSFRIDRQKDGLPMFIETYFEPSYIPDGYRVSETEKSETRQQIIYTNDHDEVIIYSQSASQSIGVNTEGVEICGITVSGCDGYYYVNKGYIGLIWFDEYTYILHLPDLYPIEDVLHMAESLAISE